MVPVIFEEIDMADSELHQQVLDARSMLYYAAGAGIDVDEHIRREVLRAASDTTADSSPDDAASLLAGITRLAQALSPVTAFSLVACNSVEVSLAVKVYRKVAVVLALLIIPISLATFVTSAISEATLKDITDGNALAVKLSDQVSPAKTTGSANQAANANELPRTIAVIRDLQTLAGTTRALVVRAKQLNWFMANIVDVPALAARTTPENMRQSLDLRADLPDVSAELTKQISNYQLARQFAQSTRESISTVYGAIAVGVLPVLYALLGAVAFLLRSYQQQLKDRTFTGKDSHVARFVTAAIGGGIVGLFTNFTSSSGPVAISPLAIAFLVGYATDVFFSFLDSFLQTFNRGSSPATAATVTKSKP